MTGPGDLYKFKARLMPWTCRGLETLDATGTAWWDGDTVNALVSMGRHDYGLVHIRCAGYNAPEIHGATKPAGEAAAVYARSLAEVGAIVFLNSLAFQAADEEDDFGRMLATVTLADGRDLAAVMIAAGHAIPDPA